MPEHITLRHLFGGGWATDLGPVSELPLQEGGIIRFPFLAHADNIEYELHGGVLKVGGTAKFGDETVDAADADVMGVHDFWRLAGSSTAQKILAHADTDVYDITDGAGPYSTLGGTATSLTAGAVVNYSQLDDWLIVHSDSDNLFVYDGTTAQSPTTGGPVKSLCGTVHKGYAFSSGGSAVGTANHGSYVHWSVRYDPNDWSSATSGSIAIDPDDGDWITGMVSFKKDLWVFKGPHKGSIHRITGSSNADFAHDVFLKGVGCIAHNTIVRYSDDIAFMWRDGSIRSLKATAAFGDFHEAFLSLPINRWLADNVVEANLDKASGVNDPKRGRMIWTIPTGSSSTPNLMIAYDYRMPGGGWWAKWDFVQASILASVLNSGVQEIWAGGDDGWVRRLNQSVQSVDDTIAIKANAETPFINYGTPFTTKTLVNAGIGITPVGNADVKFGWKRDMHPLKTKEFPVFGGVKLGTFVLDTDTLAGQTFSHKFIDTTEGGEFRSIAFSFSNRVLDQGMNIHNIVITLEQGADSEEVL